MVITSMAAKDFEGEKINIIRKESAMGYTRRDIPLLFEKVADIPIESIIGDRLDLVKKGAYYQGLCPFHNDKRLGSFVVTPARKRWKCFTCGGDIGGDGVRFIALLDGTDRIQAMLQIALDKGLITTEDYEVLSKPSGNGKVNPVKHTPKKQYEARPKKEVDAEILDGAYTAFIKSCKLSDADKKYLEGRKVEEPYLSDFFTFPRYSKEFMVRFGQNLKEQNLSFEDLKAVPGFYLDETNKWNYMRISGVAFPIRNERDQIVGIQIRTNWKSGSRYVWFSSLSVETKEGCQYGCGPGSPIDVVRTPVQKNHVICITEGKFKAISLANIGLTTLSMQGISNWKAAADLAHHMIETEEWFKSSKKTTVWLCYDADARLNEPVYRSLKNIAKELKNHGHKYLFCTWPFWAGKGIDDVLNAGHIKTIKKTSTIPLYSSKKLKTCTFSINACRL